MMTVQVGMHYKHITTDEIVRVVSKDIDDISYRLVTGRHTMFNHNKKESEVYTIDLEDFRRLYVVTNYDDAFDDD